MCQPGATLTIACRTVAPPGIRVRLDRVLAAVPVVALHDDATGCRVGYEVRLALRIQAACEQGEDARRSRRNGALELVLDRRARRTLERRGSAHAGPSSWNAVTCMPPGASSRALSERHGVSVGRRDRLGTARLPVRGGRRGIRHLEGDAHRERVRVCAAGEPDLDPVDEPHLLRVREFERRARDLEDVHAGAVLLGVGLALGQARRRRGRRRARHPDRRSRARDAVVTRS